MAIEPDDLDFQKTLRADGQIILGGRYRIVSELGRGGMGVVYLAEDIHLQNRKAAIKMLPPVLAKNKRAIEALKREALLAMELSHPHIITLRAFEQTDDGVFLVMDYVEGQTLEDVLAGRGKLDEEEMLKIFVPIAEALDFAHRRKVIHRDVKPSNIILAADDAPYIMDFGIAREMKDTYTRVTGKGTSGTLPYMSPEQLRGASPSPAQDIYSLAATMYECLAGRPPFHRGQIEYQIVNDPPEPILSCSSNINAAIKAGLAKRPEDRPGSVKALIKELSEGRGRRNDGGKSPARKELSGQPVPWQVQAKSEPKKPEAWVRDNHEVASWTVYTAWPFDANEAKRRQEETAAVLGVPAKTSLDLGNGVPMELVLIPAGEFVMGSPKGQGPRDEHPRHRVRISKPFYIGTCEVTQGQYQAVEGTNPSYFKPGLFTRSLLGKTADMSLPVERVSYLDALEFCRKLSSKVGRAIQLPTEAQWEYACRAGSAGQYCFGDSKRDLKDYGWCGGFGGNTRPVGKKCPNHFGLYDVHGNVWEWCKDWYGSYASGDQTDSAGPSSGRYRVLRGGSWLSYACNCRSSSRIGYSPTHTYHSDGFRVVVGNLK
jgi:formylglycine-generating enzyme required for sulfatase activity/predicted Ser/Thr protein kinase